MEYAVYDGVKNRGEFVAQMKHKGWKIVQYKKTSKGWAFVVERPTGAE